MPYCAPHSADWGGMKTGALSSLPLNDLLHSFIHTAVLSGQYLLHLGVSHRQPGIPAVCRGGPKIRYTLKI